jgi:HAD superfamily hydrolase (TIGR01509 family)
VGGARSRRSGLTSTVAIDAVVFDLDGTLVDSRLAVTHAHRASFEAVSTLEELRGVSGLPAFHERLAELAPDLRPFPGIPELLAQLKVPLAVVSGASREACRIVLDATGLAPCFEVVVSGDDVRKAKPHPEGLRLACSRLGVVPSRAVYVGDLQGDVAAARSCGAVAVSAGWAYGPTPEADYVLEHPDELLALLA